MKRKIFVVIFFAAVLACSCYGLLPRFKLEALNNNVSIIVDYREILTLAKNSGLNFDDAILSYFLMIPNISCQSTAPR